MSFPLTDARHLVGSEGRLGGRLDHRSGFWRLSALKLGAIEIKLGPGPGELRILRVLGVPDFQLGSVGISLLLLESSDRSGINSGELLELLLAPGVATLERLIPLLQLGGTLLPIDGRRCIRSGFGGVRSRVWRCRRVCPVQCFGVPDGTIGIDGGALDVTGVLGGGVSL